MKFKGIYKRVKDLSSGMGWSFLHREKTRHPTGEVFFRLEHADGSIEERHLKNVITKDFSLLMARLAKDPLEPRHGIFALAVGSGDAGWDLQNPPVETEDQRSLHSEIGRKIFVETAFIDPDTGNPVARPTNVVDFTTTFVESEAVGAIVEMGLIGGDLNEDTSITNPITPPSGPYDDTLDVTGFDILCNYLTFPVINKPATARMTLTWRISF